MFKLPASTLQQARDKGIAAYKGYLTRKKQGRKASIPQFRYPLPIRLAAENLRVFPERSALRVSTPDGFLWLPLIIPEVQHDLTQLKHGISEIKRYGDDWYLLLMVKSEDVPAQTSNNHFGLDLGLANTAVLYGPGVTKFWSGKSLRYTQGRYFRYRQALQKKQKIGMIKRSKGKESRWTTDMNHKISREIVNIVAAHGGVLHVEKLLGIRDRTKCTRKVNRMLHSWPFAQLLSFTTYKCRLAGVEVIEEDPRYTSQRCSRCGYIHRLNRTKQALFKCRKCGFQIHSDLNAGRNLAAKGVNPLGVGNVILPWSREMIVSDHDNCNLASSVSGSPIL